MCREGKWNCRHVLPVHTERLLHIFITFFSLVYKYTKSQASSSSRSVLREEGWWRTGRQEGCKCEIREDSLDEGGGWFAERKDSVRKERED